MPAEPKSICLGVPMLVVSAAHNLHSAPEQLTAGGVNAVIAEPLTL
jgi:hypothetical protein